MSEPAGFHDARLCNSFFEKRGFQRASHQVMAVCHEVAAEDYKDRDTLNNGFLMSRGIFRHVLHSPCATLFSKKIDVSHLGLQKTARKTP
ncbi:hypothetical protein ACIQAL_12520 [Pseudomonas sp. NPDC088368]|uniref:hypothetical protein n=1 Tax=Pseudomonas sp. NPDC088368 TaxID=3364453 RepID=UPI00380A2E19